MSEVGSSVAAGAAPLTAGHTPGPWEVVRQDHEDGSIAYEVWSAQPYEFLFAIYESLTPAAKAIAGEIVGSHNALVVSKNG